MKKYFTETVTINGTATLLHTVEMPKDGNLNMPTNSLGYYVDAAGELYYPVNPLVHTYIGRGVLRELTWHAIRNIQRTVNEETKSSAIQRTRRLYQLHEILLGQNGFEEALAKALCEVQGLTILLTVRKEVLPPYKALGPDTFAIAGIPVDKDDLILLLKEAADWYIWEADQPDHWFRAGWLLRHAVISLHACYDVQGISRTGLANKVAARINADHFDDPVPIKQIREVMSQMVIPACCDELSGDQVKEMKKMKAHGFQIRHIAEHFGVSQGLVRKMLNAS